VLILKNKQLKKMENKAKNALKGNKEKVEKILEYRDELYRVIPGQTIGEMNRCLEFMVPQLEKAIDGDDVKPINEEVAKISRISRTFADAAMEKEIKPIFRDLAENFLAIVHNWNIATVKNPQISTNVRLTDGIIKAQMSIMDAILVLRKTIERAKTTQQYEPPSFELSRSYLDNLKEAIEEGGSDALVEKKVND
jgi:hypothetical protein